MQNLLFDLGWTCCCFASCSSIDFVWCDDTGVNDGASVFRTGAGCKRAGLGSSGRWDVSWRGCFGGRLFTWSRAGKLSDDLFGSRFAHGAIAVVDAALRQRELASTSAAFRVELVKCDLPLLRTEPRKIHTGKLAGAIGVREEDL